MRNLQRMKQEKKYSGKNEAPQKVSTAVVKERENSRVYKRHQEYIHEIMQNCKTKTENLGNRAHEIGQRHSNSRRRRSSASRRRRRRRRKQLQETSPARRTACISRRRRLHGWSNDDMNWRVKKADRENWRKGFRQATGLGQTSHRGQCSKMLGTQNQDSSWRMTSQSLTAPIACDQQQENKSFRPNKPRRQRLRSASGSLSL